MIAKDRGTTVSYTFATATSVGITPEALTTEAERAQNEKIRLSELWLSEQADILRWHSQLFQDVKRDVEA